MEAITPPPPGQDSAPLGQRKEDASSGSRGTGKSSHLQRRSHAAARKSRLEQRYYRSKGAPAEHAFVGVLCSLMMLVLLMSMVISILLWVTLTRLRQLSDRVNTELPPIAQSIKINGTQGPQQQNGIPEGGQQPPQATQQPPVASPQSPQTDSSPSSPAPQGSPGPPASPAATAPYPASRGEPFVTDWGFKLKGTPLTTQDPVSLADITLNLYRNDSFQWYWCLKCNESLEQSYKQVGDWVISANDLQFRDVKCTQVMRLPYDQCWVTPRDFKLYLYPSDQNKVIFTANEDNEVRNYTFQLG